MGASDFTTKDSGERAVFDSGMQRDTQAGKPRFDLMFPLDVPYDEQMLTRLAALYGRGSEKYDDRNWEKANSDEELTRMKSSAFRHFMQWFCGESDEDHAAGAMFNIIAFESTSYKMAQGPAPVRFVETVEMPLPVPEDDDDDGPGCERDVPWYDCSWTTADGCVKANHDRERASKAELVERRSNCEFREKWADCLELGCRGRNHHDTILDGETPDP